MKERCKSIRSILRRGKGMFVDPIQGSGGAYDEGSHHERGAAIMCTEFGGVNVAPANDDGRKRNWGYTSARDSEDLLEKVDKIIMATVESGIVCGIVWTQLTDVEQEQNGLYTWDRQEKLPAAQMRAVLERAKQTYYSSRT
ncbi:hypothetical protein LTR37_020840 [Vermiconidia calcicola]|uniref:Uncharacterized protein n=1 Tax=Vermiconidia calcicola TaxID=1690605 RepID=A0ACC3MA40_9PEZI|nr:hypothetical protein LTR37_020840 [Vermiconidia calcicola]